MIGGRDPVLIFQFSKLQNTKYADLIKDIPIAKEIPTYLSQPPIPLYLSSEYTGLWIDQEDKSVDIDADIEIPKNGNDPIINQKPVGSSVTVNLVARKDSLGLTVLSSLIDLVFLKTTTKEYAISYLSYSTTIFRAKLLSYNTSQNADTTLLNISLVFTVGEKDAKKKPDITETPAFKGATPLQEVAS